LEDFNGGDYSDIESFEELEGDQLEANLPDLRAELIAPTKYEQLMKPKLVKQWKKTEQSHTLGYNVHWAQQKPKPRSRHSILASQHQGNIIHYRVLQMHFLGRFPLKNWTMICLETFGFVTASQAPNNYE
jgi:hypothetical protein